MSPGCREIAELIELSAPLGLVALGFVQFLYAHSTVAVSDISIIEMKSASGADFSLDFPKQS